MKKHIACVGIFVLIAGCAPSESDGPDQPGSPEVAIESAVYASTDQLNAASKPFIPEDFIPPVLVENEGFKLVPLGPELVQIDFEAYMSSIEHLQQTFTGSTSWPTADISDEDAMKDMLNEERRFKNRESFAYAVLTPDGKRERGCVYVRPSKIEGHDAIVKLWVTKAEYDDGFDEELYVWTMEWVSQAWPFKKVAYPGRNQQEANSI